jgi:hypothetical protein
MFEDNVNLLTLIPGLHAPFPASYHERWRVFDCSCASCCRVEWDVLFTVVGIKFPRVLSSEGLDLLFGSRIQALYICSKFEIIHIVGFSDHQSPRVHPSSP